MSFTLGSGKRLGVSDLTSLANQKPNAISIEESVFDRLDGLCQGFSGADAQAYEISQEVKIENVKSSQFTVEMRRAALIYRVHTLLSGKTPVRAATIKALTDLINYQITPFFSTFEKSGLELVEFLSGKGFASTVEKDVVTAAEAFSLVGITAHSLANFEVRAFQRHPFLLVGLSALVIGGANHLVKAADSIAALSVEAKGVIIDAFDPTAFETNRQHRGQITSATTLKLLLEGSKRASSVKDINNTYTAFNNIPQINGPSLDVIAQATK
jgi:histidine ammonia-lyase